MANSADFDMLWANCPQYYTVRKIITNIPAGWETCCIQMSHAMNMAGLPVNYSDKKRVLVFNGREHMLDVKEMRGYLNTNYEDADVISRVDANGKLVPRIAIQSYLDQRQGIIAFGGRHIDLWNGTQIHGKNYIESALWEAPSAIREGIFFWDVSDSD